LRFADDATEAAGAGQLGHLHRIGVYQRHQRPAGDEDVAFVEVADDVAAVVQGADGGGEVAGGAEQVALVELRAEAQARPRVEELHRRVGVGDAGHDVADDGVPVGQQQAVQRPGDGGVRPGADGGGRRGGEHGGELGSVLGGPAVVDLGEQLVPARH